MVFKIVIASTNDGKIKEIGDILNSLKWENLHSQQQENCLAQAEGRPEGGAARMGEVPPDLTIQIRSLQDYLITEPDEPHDNFLKNAIHKAKYYAQYTKEATLSEDSGLSIEALKGFPGVRTKEFTQECGGMKNTFIKLEQMLLLQGFQNPTAYFHSAAALYLPTQDLLITHEARDDGVISFPPRGEDGFAFDPIFIPKGYDRTFAELGPSIKNKISHRSKAIHGLMKKWGQIAICNQVP